MRLFESCQYRSYVILWHTDSSVHTRVVKAIDSNIPVFLPFFSFFFLNFHSGGVWASLLCVPVLLESWPACLSQVTLCRGGLLGGDLDDAVR